MLFRSIWFDTDDNLVYRYTTDGVSSHWLDLSGPTFSFAAGTVPRFISISVTGVINAPLTGNVRYYPPLGMSVQNVAASVSSAPPSDLSFSLLKNGSSVGTYTITTGSYRLLPQSANISLTTSDYLTVNVTSGSAENLRLDLQYI